MSVAEDVLKNFNLFVDGRGYAGKVEEITPPKLTIKTEDFRAGGMDAALDMDMGMEKLELSFVMLSKDKEVLQLFGVTSGATVPLTARGALESFDGTTTPVVLKMRGRIKSIEEGNWSVGSKSTMTVGATLSYYKREQGGEVLHEIDIENMVRIIGGKDQLKAQRDAIGI